MWSKGSLTIGGCEFVYEVKHFESDSKYGIDGGKISKLSIRREGEEVVSYERGWDLRPKDSLAKQAFSQVLKKYN